MIRCTAKQIQILDVIKSKNPDGTYCTVYDIMENLSYPVKRDALLHSISILVANGYVERKDGPIKSGKRLRCFCVTTKALEVV